MEKLRAKYLSLLSTIDLSIKRFIFEQIEWKDRLIIIQGQRGVGKTTLILQYIKTTQTDLSKTLYISMDDIYFSNNSLSDFVEKFVIDGGKYLLVDEIHRYKGWSQEIKNIYDFYPELKIVITGSSALDFYINSADLGRRASVYSLPELSFREYLLFIHKKAFNPILLEDIIENHEKIAVEINSKIKSVKLFKEYIQNGAYPFVINERNKYFEKLEAIINTVIDNDIPAIENISFESRIKLKKLLIMISSSTPFKVNFSELSRKLETSRDVLTKYLNLLYKSGLIKLLTTDGIGHAIIRKPDKIYISNTNLIFAISSNIDTGTLRETFFLNQLSYNHRITYPKTADFVVNNKYTFEIGGQNKTNKQIGSIENAFLAIDDIEYGYKNKIPLWMFGFLY
ncbi:MAG: AAA family ATPase [Saprospiraceae bacterium]|nr:AAA family ATPase [Saprospiraceae bacterium]